MHIYTITSMIYYFYCFKFKTTFQIWLSSIEPQVHTRKHKHPITSYCLLGITVINAKGSTHNDI